MDRQYQQPMMNRPKQERNIAVCIILSIVTCGIYGLYWLYSMAEDMKTVTGDANATSGGVLILLTIITCGIYLWYWMYKQGCQIDAIKTARGIPSSSTGVIYLVLCIFELGIVAYALLQNELNNLFRG